MKRKIDSLKTKSPVASITAVTLSSILLLLTGCNSGNNGSTDATNNSSLASSKSAGLKGAFGSYLGRAAFSAMPKNVLLEETCVDTQKLNIFESSHYNTGFSMLGQTSSVSTDSGAKSDAISAGLSGGYGAFSVSVKTEFSSKETYEDTAMEFDSKFGFSGTHYLNAPSTFPGDLLRKGYWDNNQFTPAFFKNCGDSYVQQEDYGVFFTSIVSLQFSSRAAKHEFSSTQGASFGSLVSLENAIKNSSETEKSKINIHISLIQEGGQPDQLTRVFESSEVTCSASQSDLAGCFDRVIGKINRYQSTIADQIRDEKGNLNPSRLAYINPVTVKYNNGVTSDKVDPILAIHKLQKLFQDNETLRYGLKQEVNELMGSGADVIINNQLLNKLEQRRLHIIEKAPSCYKDKDYCASTTLPQIFKDFQESSDYKIDADLLLYYSQYYASDNFLNLNKLYGITEVDLNPLMDGNFQLGENIDGCGTSQSFCHVGNPATLKLQFLKGDSGNLDINYYGFGNNKVSSTLATSCTKNGDSFSCYSSISAVPGKNSSVYTWNETLMHKYIGNLTEAEIRDFANPKSSY